ncbi:MAG TPA: type II secretion system F family protein [archaeon]|jgi:flagellar protein FlaJ|nr:type II secretion system F family protein [archaeon]HPV66077.1 type II secretion system F family protein [archaeon]
MGKLKELMDRYQIYLYSQKLKIKTSTWFALVIIVSLLIGVLAFLINARVGILLFAIILDLGLGMPFYLYFKNLDEIEKYWPEALRLIADTMKSGSSLDYALREASSADFGPLSKEFDEVIRRLEMGDTMSQSLEHMALRIESKIVRRTVTLIQECLKTGAQLAEVLEEIANDTKQMFRIKKERETKTMLQVIFIFAAGAVIAPFIFGLTNVITQFLTTISSTAGVATESALATATATQKSLAFLLDVYLLIEVAAAAVIISLMRQGKFTKAVVFFPVMVIVSFIIYMVSQAVISGILIEAI